MPRQNQMVSTCKNGITYYFYPPWEATGRVGHGFSSRLGGVSQGKYTALNLGYKGGDDPASVLENRRRFLQLWGKKERDLVYGEQVHGTEVSVAGEKERGGAIPATDGLVTVTRGVILGAFSADCQLLYFFDPGVPAIGLVHAGWRGTLGGIAQRAVSSMEKNLGARTATLQVLMAPFIGPCCYEVGAEVIHTAASSRWKHDVVLYSSSRGGEHAFFDLAQTNRNILRSCGLKDEHVILCNTCTRCNDHLFYSYRHAGGAVTGSQMGIMFLH